MSGQRFKTSSKLALSSKVSWLYGVHAVIHALQNKKRTLDKLLILKKNAPELLALLEEKKLDSLLSPTIVDEETFQKILPKEAVHQGIALSASPLPFLTLEDVLKGPEDGPLTLLFLDHVTDPQNVGTILRSAAAFGVDGVGLLEHHSPALTGALAKAASGALELVPLILLKNLAQSMELLKKRGFWCLGLDERGEKLISEVDFSERVIFIMGSEGEGLRRLSREKCDLLVKIPTTPFFPTLNVSISAAVCLYENRRQKMNMITSVY